MDYTYWSVMAQLVGNLKYINFIKFHEYSSVMLIHT